MNEHQPNDRSSPCNGTTNELRLFSRLVTKSALPLAPMEALLAVELPKGSGWQYEPKWDGFRCLAKRENDKVSLTSKSGKPLGRYFPEVAEMLGTLATSEFLLDGELIIAAKDTLSFERLQLRLHPAQGRVLKLAKETPAQFMAFDLIECAGTSLTERPLSERRELLERFFHKNVTPGLQLSPMTCDPRTALSWLENSGGALDGVIAKRRDRDYRPGERAMIKVKLQRTADCVVGGFRYLQKTDEVGSLLLGLYDEAGLLNHVGFTSAIPASQRESLTKDLQKLIEPPGFTGSAPGAPSRWSSAKSARWEPLRPVLVAEVRYDQLSGRRFRHGTGFIRWRPDKTPKSCTYDQLAPGLKASDLKLMFAA